MATKIFSCFVDGLEAHLIEVEVDILQGLPGLSIVGLGDTAVQEAKERIRSAIKNSGASYPQQKKIINLAPAHLRKNGASFDVPMALGLLAASDQIRVPENAIIVGELALNGEIRPVNGALSIGLFAQKHRMELYLPEANMGEAALIEYPHIYGVSTLKELIEHFQGTRKIVAGEPSSDATVAKASAFKSPAPGPTKPAADVRAGEQSPGPLFDMNLIQGQDTAKRVMEVAAAGGHHVLT